MLPEQDRWEIDHCHLWYQIRSYLIRKSDVPQFLKWGRKQNWMGRWMPEGSSLYDVFLGEYPWHPASESARRNAERGHSKLAPCDLLVTSNHYVWETSGFDCSVEDTVTGHLPSSQLMAGLNLRWSGSQFNYIDTEDKVIVWDPSASLEGPSTLLIDQGSLSDYLAQNDLALVWTILGEKQIYGPSVLDRNRPQPGWHEIYGLYALEGDRVCKTSLQTSFRESC